MINTELWSNRLRQRAIDTDHRRILVSDFRGTDQEKDLTEPANCDGVGRIRHYRRETSASWPENPLPIDPASRALALGHVSTMRAQLFQNAACNWRCWYCYVPFSMLNANPRHSQWLSAERMVELYLEIDDPPKVIVLSGGQPDLVPEWILWTMQELEKKGLDQTTYLWSDDNLSNDFIFRFLSATELDRLAAYRNYGRVCCFKGFDNASFAFNTGAEPSLFGQQFELFRRLMQVGIDVYAYVTLTCPDRRDLKGRIKRFLDSLQGVSDTLPLRMVPLEIRHFTPVTRRLDSTRVEALDNQQQAVEIWMNEVEERFPDALQVGSITDVCL